MSFQTVIYEKEDALARVTLNRPDVLNAYNVQMRDDLFEVFSAIRDDPDIRVVVVSGAGRAYCAGADLTEFGTAPSPVWAREVRRARDLWGTVKDLDKILIVAMHGFAFGSGLELALLCDLRLAAEGTRFGLPETSLGFIPAAGGTQSLPRIVKPGTARRLILTGDRIDAAEAYDIGLVHRVVAAESLVADAEALAQRLLRIPTTALRLSKEALRQGMDLGLEQGLELESRLADFAFATRDVWHRLRTHQDMATPYLT